MEVRAAYEQTELAQIPEDWESPSVGDIATFSSGAGINVARLSPESSDAPVPVFGGNGIAGYTTVPLVSEPTIAIGRVGQKCGEVYLTDGPSWITDNALYPRKFHRRVNLRFFALALKSAGLNDLKNRNDLPLVTQAILHDAVIRVPPTTAEQEGIAAALSDADALIESLEQLLAKKREIKQGTMQELLTGKKRLPGFSDAWGMRRLADLAEIRSGGTPSTREPRFWDGDILWCTPTDITRLSGKKYLTDTERRITTEGLSASSAEVIPPRSIVMTTRATIGECAINLKPITTNQGFKNFIPFERVDPEFLFYLLTTQKQGFIALCGGSTFLEISKSQLAGYEVDLPISKAEQHAISETLGAIDLEIETLEGRIFKARQLKQGMMQELLTGRIRLV